MPEKPRFATECIGDQGAQPQAPPGTARPAVDDLPALDPKTGGSEPILAGNGRAGPTGASHSVLPADFNIVVGLTGDDAVAVSVSGGLDTDAIGRLRAVLSGILRAGHRRVVVDLARAVMPDGAQEMLAKMLKRARAQGGDLVVRWAAVRPAS